jgi:hypothetical protein
VLLRPRHYFYDITSNITPHTGVLQLATCHRPYGVRTDGLVKQSVIFMGLPLIAI